MALNKKVIALFKLMERFLMQKEISAYDETLLEEFGCDKKTLGRYLNEIESLYDHIITIKKSRQNVWRLVSVSDIFQEFINNSDDIAELFLMAREFDRDIFQEVEKSTLAKIAKNDENVFLFKNSIMEELNTPKSKKVFDELKRAIRHHEYRDIVYTYNEKQYEVNVKCLKLVFMDNNWYLALLDEKSQLRFNRLSFIESVRYSSKNSFRKNEVKPYLDFLPLVQNSMTLYGTKPKIAKIRANPSIAKYFEQGMKQFLSSQKFIEKCEDGSIIFSVAYTQELEVLPFVQKWLPDLVILEPQELKETYIKKLQATLENHLN